MNTRSKQSAAFVIAEDERTEHAGEGITRQILGYGPDLMAVKVWFEEGAIGYQHEHPHTQVSYVESGEFEATINGETKLLVAGDSFYVEPHQLHGAVCKKAGVLIDIFNPHREDFLQEVQNENS